VPIYLTGRQALIGDVALGLITKERYPAAKAVSAAANFGLDAVCLPTGALQARSAQPGPADLSAEQILGFAHRVGLEVMAWTRCASMTSPVRTPRSLGSHPSEPHAPPALR
jgi:hypothetical protein